MIDAVDLEIVFTHGVHKDLTKASVFYFIGIVRKGAAMPAWAAKAR